MARSSKSKTKVSTLTPAEEFAVKYTDLRNASPMDHQAINDLFAAAALQGIGRWEIYHLADGGSA